jgi:membrane protein YdbS with pleckstrin-like domain
MSDFGLIIVLATIGAVLPIAILLIGPQDALLWRLWSHQDLRTWHYETLIIAFAIGSIVVLSGGSALEWLGFGAILMAHGRSSINYRMMEEQQRLGKGIPGYVECWRWSWVHLIGAEILWALYFAFHRSWAALAGVGVMLSYARWRSWYTNRLSRRAPNIIPTRP